MANRQMALAVLVQGTGAHPASWLSTDTQTDASTDIDYYTDIARLAERGRFDLFFIADIERKGGRCAARGGDLLDQLVQFFLIAGSDGRGRTSGGQLQGAGASNALRGSGNQRDSS